MRTGKKFEELVKLVAHLRSKKGCPWDRKQTHRSMIKCLKEETLEVIEAIRKNKTEGLKEELGDLLLQVLFHGQLAKEKGRFDIDNVIRVLIDKLKRRHPHVFGNVKLKTAHAALQSWRRIKKNEKS